MHVAMTQAEFCNGNSSELKKHFHSLITVSVIYALAHALEKLEVISA